MTRLLRPAGRLRRAPPRHFFKGLLRKKHLYRIPFAQSFAAFRLFPVQSNILFAQHAIKEALISFLKDSQQIFVQALAPVQRTDFQFPQILYPL